MKISGVDSHMLNGNQANLVKSFQGEGEYAGHRIVVLRFCGCNLACNWNTANGRTALCDTAWTWNGTEKGEDWDVDKLAARVVKESRRRLPRAEWEDAKLLTAFKRAEFVMITGGEPMLRQGQPAFQALVEKIREKGLPVHYETNGTRTPNEWFRSNTDYVVCSPKYQLYPKEYTREKIRAWQDSGIPMEWKFVVGNMRDVELLGQWVLDMGLSKDANIYLMPLTTNDKRMTGALDVLNGGVVSAFTDTFLAFKHVRLSPRLQISGNFP